MLNIIVLVILLTCLIERKKLWKGFLECFPIKTEYRWFQSLFASSPVSLLGSCPIFPFHPNQWMDEWYLLFLTRHLLQGKLSPEVSDRLSSLCDWLELGHMATTVEGNSWSYEYPVFSAFTFKGWLLDDSRMVPTMLANLRRVGHIS